MAKKKKQLKKGGSGGWDRKQHEQVRRILGDYKIVDAKNPFRFVVKAEDVAHANQKDPYSCAIAKAVERLTGVKAIAIYRTIAYIPFDKKEDGNKIIERFRIDRATTQAIKVYDQTGKFEPGEYYFNPPSKSIRLDYKQPRKSKNVTEHREQRIVGRTVSGWDKANPSPKWLNVRNGKGMVSFKSKVAGSTEGAPA
jgi:hypothetical protein